jgi:hypothetical protein
MADSIVSADVRAQSSKQFSYPSLDDQQQEIRVLELLAGDYDDPIDCSLRFERLENAPAYEALSYVWGDPNITANIYINKQAFAITTNLEAFLRRIRLPDRHRSLWVDALCINQQDNSEKAHQVHLMGNIYKNCQQGLIWLGELASHDVTASGARALFDYLEYVALRRSLAASELTEPRLSKIFVTMEAMMKSQWWQRIWTIQEALLPPSATVLFGSESCLWSTIEEAGRQFIRQERYDDTDSPLPELTTSTHRILNHWFLYPVSAMRIIRKGEPPFYSLWRFRGRRATDPRDKVFGLLGLLSERFSFGEYWNETGYNLDVASVFARTTLELMKADNRGLQTLVGRNCGQQQLPPDATPGVPSWAVDWAAWRDGDYECNIWRHFEACQIYNCARTPFWY